MDNEVHHAELARDAVDVLRPALSRFVERRMRRRYGPAWRAHALGAVHTVGAMCRTRPEDLDRDEAALLQVIGRLWGAAFCAGAPRFARQYVDEVREFRNVLAHNEPMAMADLFRMVDTVHRLLALIEAPEQDTSQQLRRVVLRAWVRELANGD